jgi:hypothetical protein
MKVIGAGFGRTGTTSTKVALQKLGFGPCLHMIDTLANQDLAAVFLGAHNGEPTDWVAALDEWESTIDWPSCSFYKAHMEAFPDAKVILNIRDSEGWYKSVNDTIFPVARHNASNPETSDRTSVKMIKAVIWEGDMEGQFEDKDYAISLYEKHNQEVQEYVPADRLLVFDVKQGWEPFCSFLGVDVPDEPFPHANDTESFKAMIQSGAALSGDRAKELSST